MRELDKYLMSLSLEELCALHIRSVVASCNGNMKAAAKILKIARTTLYRYMTKDRVLRRSLGLSTYDQFAQLDADVRANIPESRQ